MTEDPKVGCRWCQSLAAVFRISNPGFRVGFRGLGFKGLGFRGLRIRAHVHIFQLDHPKAAKVKQKQQNQANVYTPAIVKKS